MKLTFKLQLLSGVILVIIGSTLSFAFHNGIFLNIAWIVYGLLFILNPVYPERLKQANGEKTAKRVMRIAGVLCILIGLLTRYIV